METRENWGSRFGFIMAAAGSAVGIGNIWRFPYVAGENGGGAFLLIYVAIILAFGLSVALAEMLVGRTGQRNPVGAFRAIKPGIWSGVGYLGVLTGFIILSFYIVVAGWTLTYIVLMLDGSLVGVDPARAQTIFFDFAGGTVKPILAAGVFMLLTAVVVAGGIGKGIERASKVLMPALFILLLILALRSMTLPGAAEGLRFFLVPDFSKVTGDTITAALAQAFFSLSLGMGTMLTYGSYLRQQENLPSAGLTIVALDSIVAIVAGLMILPAVFSAGFSPSAGVGLTFFTLPAVFDAMPGGTWFGVAFFTLLAIAALTSAVSILQPMIAYVTEEHQLPRGKVIIVAALICFGLGVPSSLSFGPLADLSLFGRNWFDLMDFLSNSVLLPLGGLLTALFVGWVWGRPAIAALSNQGTLNQPWAPIWFFILRFVAPLGIGWILLQAFIGA